MRLTNRHRAGLLLAGFVMAAPLFAAPASAGTTTITFSGTPPLGLSTLACPSTPSQTSLTVPADSVVNFVNRTGRPATLWAGDSQKVLPDKSLVPVTFGAGPAKVVVQMVPQCSLDLGKHVSMTVTVVAATSAPPPPVGGAPVSGTGAGTPRSDGTTAKGQPEPAIPPAPTASATPAAGANSASTGSSDNNPFAPAPTDVAAQSDAAVKNPIFGKVAGPKAPRSASGLLTLIATVGVVGVAAAAIRAILAQRANRVLPA